MKQHITYTKMNKIYQNNPIPTSKFIKKPPQKKEEKLKDMTDFYHQNEPHNLYHEEYRCPQ